MALIPAQEIDQIFRELFKNMTVKEIHLSQSEHEAQFKLSLAMLMLEIAGYPAKSEQFNDLYKRAVQQLNENAKRDYAAFLAADLDALRTAMKDHGL